MTDRDRLKELIDEARRNFTASGFIADHLLANGVILPRCDVGDTVYFLLEDDIPEHRFYISEERVTEVCSKGFFISAFFPAEDDLGEYFLWDSIGKEIFLTREEAEAMLEMKGGIEDEGNGLPG